jgi:MinD superfamily P-loop ATPase
MEIAIISGKGGTGKSSVSAALATLCPQVVLADCDVDAANLHLLFGPEVKEEIMYSGEQKARIDETACTGCGLCIDYCRFGAISSDNGRIILSEITCDGCKLCFHVCPEKAISMVTNNDSRVFAGDFRNGKMVFGILAPGEGNSGKLVNRVRDKARELSQKKQINMVIIDGPPGIGCPAISSITGVDKVVVVTEPTLSALQDLKRTIELISGFSSQAFAVINKYDLNEEMTREIVRLCLDHHWQVIGQIPFDEQIVTAMIQCKSIVEWSPASAASIEISRIWQRLIL